MRVHPLAQIALVLASTACSSSHGLPGGGVCCPVTSARGCLPGHDEVPRGGWAASAGECTTLYAHGSLLVATVDEHGCTVVSTDPTYCCGCIREHDAGVDAGAPDAGGRECEGLTLLSCLQSGCVPTFDDRCCPTCEPHTGCADCSDLTYYVCRPFRDACEAAFCSQAPQWQCAGSMPDCSRATATDHDSCTVPGCVPAHPPGVGEPDPGRATCVPIHALMCTASCERVPPACPTGTTAEADGLCYTDRCIPAAVCE